MVYYIYLAKGKNEKGFGSVERSCERKELVNSLACERKACSCERKAEILRKERTKVNFRKGKE